jgi:hypothetical protein
MLSPKSAKVNSTSYLIGFGIFLIGTFYRSTFNLFEAKFFPFEVLLFLVNLFNFKYIQERYPRILSYAIFLSALNAIGILLANYYFEISMSEAILESANIFFFFSNVLFLVLLFFKNCLLPLLIGNFIGAIIFPIFFQVISFPLASVWKYELGLAVLLLFIYNITNRGEIEGKNLIWIVTAFFFASISLYFDSRFLALSYLSIAILMLFWRVGNTKKSLVQPLLLLALTLIVGLSLYSYLVRRGLLGADAYFRYVQASKTDQGFLLASRNNVWFTLQYLLQSPIFGYGTDRTVDFSQLLNSQYLANSESIALLQSEKFTPHSGLLRSWYSGGILGLIAFATFLSHWGRLVLLGFRQARLNWIFIIIGGQAIVGMLLNPLSAQIRLQYAMLFGITLFSLGRAGLLPQNEVKMSSKIHVK